MKIRKVTGADWDELRQIRLEALLDEPAAYGSTYEESESWPDANWQKMASEWLYYFAEVEGEVVGMLSGGYNDNHPGTWWMYGMYVSPEFRGQGIADELVNAVCDWAKSEGADALYLHVTETLERSRGFYEKMGFVLNGERIVMDRDPSIALVTMVKNFD